MPKTDEKFLVDRLEMTETKGFIDLVADLKNLEENIGNLNNINSEQDLWVIKGQLRIINFIVNLENATHLALEELQDGNPT